MSMTPDSENFEDLQRLLTLKRYEQPPPGYFHHFSGTVISRIEAGETGESGRLSVRISGNGSWFHNFWKALERRPALTGAFGIIVCGFFISGIALSEKSDGEAAYVTEKAPPLALVRNVEPTPDRDTTLFHERSAGSLLAQGLVNVSSTNGASVIRSGSLFDSLRPQSSLVSWPPQ